MRVLWSVTAALVLILALPICSRGQWTQVSSTGLIGAGPYRNQGAMAYTDGVAWAGVWDVYRSNDRGSTWTKVVSPWRTLSGYIVWISFLDKDHGCVSGQNGLLITQDGGITWKQVLWGKNIFCGAFLGTTNDILVSDQQDATLEISHDGGSSWKTIRLPNDAFLKDMRVYEPGHVIGFIEFAYAKGNSSAVMESTDFGETWTIRSGRIDPDSHSFEVLRCDHSIVIGINEEGGNYTNMDGTGEIFRSTDGGNSFTTVLTRTQGTLRGSVVATRGMVYTASYSGQMLESSDEGVSWQTTSSPTLPIDSHGLIAIDDTTLLATDQYGTIYRRVDTRGAIVQTNAADPGITPTIASFDKPLTPCSAPDSLLINITKSCATADVRSIDLVAGPSDAASFSASRSGDRILIVFTPSEPGTPKAILKLTLTNGKTISIPITATVHESVKPQFFIADLQTDTIGATVYLPIRIRTEFDLADLSFSVNYDTTDLQYVGATFDTLPTDLTERSTLAHSRIHLSNVGTDTANVIWIAFRYFPTQQCTSITIDSMSYSALVSGVCAFDTAMTATICAPPDCNQSWLSHYVRYGQLTFADVHFTSAERILSIRSNVDIPDATISVVNSSGSIIYRTSRDLRSGSTERLQLTTLPSGAYTVQIISGAHYQTFRFEYIR